MELSPEAYGQYPRAIHDSYAPAGMGYDANTVYAEVPFMYTDDDMHVSSNLSSGSASSSTMGSPLSNPGQMGPIPEWAAPPGLLGSPGIVDQNDYFPTGTEYSFASGMEAFNPHFDFSQATKGPGFVDPSLIHPELGQPMAMPHFDNTFPPQSHGYPASPALSPSPQLRPESASSFMHRNTTRFSHSPFAAPTDLGRRQSLVSYHSNHSGEQSCSGDESKEKQSCLDCGKTFKDLKAHMLTHQTERPEKCPIQTCEYHVKGFARKYDKNRHTLTHYKGTMVCGFCPGSGSAAEKSFNRADVFKRHLTAVHGVEQTPPNSRKKAPGSNSGKGLMGYAPDATGKCSTCSSTFANAQDFYEHLDDCVLRIVQQEDPAEAINAQHLAEVENDRDVHDTLEKNQLLTATATSNNMDEDEGEMAEEDEAAADESRAERGAVAMARGASVMPPTKKAKGNPPNGVQKSRGLTHSRGGVPLTARGRARKHKRDYPSSWGFDKGQMTMKKRVMAVFDGPRRLAKDDMMLSTEHEIRVPLSDGKSYVTDLDVQTLRRAEGFLGATDEEKGPWISDDPTEADLKRMLECGGE